MKILEQIEELVLTIDVKKYWKVFVISLFGVYWAVSLPLIMWVFDRLPEPLGSVIAKFTSR